MALLFEIWIMHFVLGPSHFVKWVISGYLFSFSNYTPINEFGTGIAVRAKQTCSLLGTHGPEGETDIKKASFMVFMYTKFFPALKLFQYSYSAINVFSL